MAHVVVGMSGGVDSAVAALLMKREGHDVTGVFMNNWEEKDESGVCTSEKDWADARHVCDILDIPVYSVNFAKDYQERVFKHFIAEYEKGRTPNPDVLCNREIKFDVFLKFAKSIGAEMLVTGHYASCSHENGVHRLLRAKDENKDQTYFLYMLNQAQLEIAHFPLGGLNKAEVREIARQNGIPVSEKKDSTGVCFIGERNFREFLKNYLPAQPGPMLTPEGKKVGEHIGLMYYTLGQRRGLGIGGGGTGERWFVVEKDFSRNALIVEQGADSPRLYTLESTGSELTWISGHAPAEEGQPFRCKVRLRHRQPLQDCEFVPEGGSVRIRFDAPQRAVTPGQSAVFYLEQDCLGGCIID